MNESTSICNEWFVALGITQTEAARHAWRELVVTTPGLPDCISGAIVYDETIRQHDLHGTSFPNLLANVGIIPGIKVDLGAKGAKVFWSFFKKDSLPCLALPRHKRTVIKWTATSVTA